MELEGVIAKRKDSQYEAGERSGSWQKLKLERQQEFVVGGYRQSQRLAAWCPPIRTTYRVVDAGTRLVCARLGEHIQPILSG
jgi:ATP-dependent DNA ligase